MERALNVELLTEALGPERARLPSPEELARFLAEAEIALVTESDEISEDLLATGWYLHAIGSASARLEVYSLDRQRRAHQVAAHIFDLSLNRENSETPDRLAMVFAAQLSYIRGGLAPNSIAVYRQSEVPDVEVLSPPGERSLALGCMLLALDRRRLFPVLQQMQSAADVISQDLVSPLRDSHYAAAEYVRTGIWHLLVHLTYGQAERLESARGAFLRALDAAASQGDLDSRWVAAHLLDVGDELSSASVWSVVPPELGQAAARAMTLGDPAVLSLWPPQVELLTTGSSSPLLPSTKRLVVSFPTSAGKTLLSQLFVLAHLASDPESKVCFVTPTHSLGREVLQSLRQRLNTMSVRAEDDGPLGLTAPTHPNARLRTMTPEKLASRLRNDPDGFLDEFGLVIVDEAHLISDGDRGWSLEATLTFLHALGQIDARAPRLILLSAALGNRAHIQQWIDPGSAPLESVHSDWRGPRRLHSVYTTRATGWEDVPATSKNGLPRQRAKLHGQLHVRTGNGTPTVLTFAEPVGTLVLKLDRKTNKFVRDGANSTRLRDLAVPLIHHLGKFGPVLTITSTKAEARHLAGSIAEAIEPAVGAGTMALADLIQTRTGDAELVAMVRKGVAFHHASLPDDILAEIETAMRAGDLQHIAATTGLIEGVNLPVHSVVIANTGYYGDGGKWVTSVDAADLVNAVGRAGRATKETEGWVVLVENLANDATFDRFTGAGDALDVHSTLGRDEVISALSEFERRLTEGEDVVLEATSPSIEEFLAYVWFLADALARLGRASTIDEITAVLDASLAWSECDSSTRQRWVSVTERALDAYNNANALTRAQWARSGLRIPVARALDAMVSELVADIGTASDARDASETLDLLVGAGRLERIVALDRRPPVFRARYNSSRLDALPVDQAQLLQDWVAGHTLEELATGHLDAVTDENFRYEQLSEYTSRMFEHHLPWMFGTLIAWTNERLTDEVLSPQVPAYVRYGIDTAAGLQLMADGVRSRRLAATVADRYHELGADHDLLPWLRSLNWVEWGSGFEATPSEIADLLNVAHTADTRVAARILDREKVSIEYHQVETPDEDHTVLQLHDIAGTSPAQIGVWAGETLLGHIRGENQNDIELVLGIGLPLDVETSGGGVLTIALVNIEDEPQSNEQLDLGVGAPDPSRLVVDVANENDAVASNESDVAEQAGEGTDDDWI